MLSYRVKTWSVRVRHGWAFLHECDHCLRLGVSESCEHFLGCFRESVWIVESSFVDECDLACPITHLDLIVLSKCLFVGSMVLVGVSSIDSTCYLECSIDPLLLCVHPLTRDFLADVWPNGAIFGISCINKGFFTHFDCPSMVCLAIVLWSTVYLYVNCWNDVVIFELLALGFFWVCRVIVPRNLAKFWTNGNHLLH